MTILSVDVETYSSVDIKKAGAYAYVESPDFEITLFGYVFDDDPVTVIDLAAGEKIPNWVSWALFDQTIIKTAFNANFERVCLAKHFNAWMPPSQWRCTQVHALTLGLPLSLDAVGKTMKLPQDKQKDAAGKALIRYFCTPCKPTKANGGRTRNLPEHAPKRWEQFKAYCKQDVEVERTIRKMLERFPVPEFEQKLWTLDQKINDYGVKVDTEMVRYAIACDATYRGKLESEAIELTGLNNPGSVAQLKTWLMEADGIEVESLNKETVPELLKQTESETVKRVLELRQEMSKTSVKKYLAMDRAHCRDERVRGLLQFYGANRTGRWCLAKGSLVLVKEPSGEVLEKPIERIDLEDRVWDGEDWVSHDGVVYSGDKEVITWDGVTATPEHIVWTGPEEKMTLGEAGERRLPLWKGNTPSIG